MRMTELEKWKPASQDTDAPITLALGNGRIILRGVSILDKLNRRGLAADGADT
jgi:hypothetical protein